MIDLVRTSLHRAISSPLGDRLFPVRVPKDLARRLNVVLGEPLCSKGELARRRSARARLDELRRGGSANAATTPSETERAAAPVVVYYERERNLRLLGRIREALDARGIRYSELDVADDPTTKDFVMREARCKEDELPIVFVATTPVGGFNELVAWDASGKLAQAVFGK